MEPLISLFIIFFLFWLTGRNSRGITISGQREEKIFLLRHQVKDGYRSIDSLTVGEKRMLDQDILDNEFKRSL